MRFVSIVLMFVGLLFVSACPELNNKAAQSNVDDLASTPKIDNTAQKKSDESIPEIAVFDLLIAPDELNQKKISDEVEDFYGSAKIEKGAEFDIMNEYGFLGKGKFIKYVKASDDEKGYWEIEILKDTLRPDIDSLSINRMQEMEKEYPILPAYGVFPSKSERKNIRSGDKVDLSEKGMSERQSVFMSLPKEIRDGTDVYNKAEQNLEYQNRWTDLDGDEKIDFLYIRVRCEEKPNSHCGKYLFLQDGKWVELTEKTVNK